MSARGALLVWLLLLLLLGSQFALAAIPGARFAPPVIGLLMALLVSMTFMDLPRAGGTAAIFAMAGVFWLGILIGLGSVDPATRHDIAAPVQTER